MMEINEYELRMETNHHIVTIIYRGNENIIINKCKKLSNPDDQEKPESILVPRYVLYNFLQLLENT